MKLIAAIATLFILSACSGDKITEITPKSGDSYPQLTGDGAWCWFSGPRAIYHHSKDGSKVISGWVTEDGSVNIGSLDLESNLVKESSLWDKLEIDDHDNPAFTVAKDGSVVVQYTKHAKRSIYQNIIPSDGDVMSASAAEELDIIDPEELKDYPRHTITYANPISLSEESGRIYSFGRWTGYKPNMIWSDDNGVIWSKAKVMITNTPFDPGNRPYVNYYSDGKSRIHIILTDGHPRNEPTNSVYYAYYEKGNFYKVDGEKICSVEELPFEAAEASVVYQATEATGKAWIFDVVATEDGSPVIGYTRYPNDKDHRYHYTIYKDGEWIDNEICSSGKWFPQTKEGKVEPEPNYSAGLVIHPGKVNTIYLSRDVDGVFEIEKRITNDDGKTWSVYPITRGSKFDNVRPVFPRNYKDGDDDLILWMENERYVHYTDYKTAVRYFIDK